mmetsp:Transcript_166460/g.528831  ORF Transcript_166460/g.528831 Transcript_166460/m.528831 type:complete len:317 (-) Transcript_166460:38-988(-)
MWNLARSLQLSTLPGELRSEGPQKAASSTGVLSTSNGSGIMSPTCLRVGALGHTWERQLVVCPFTRVPSMSKFAAPADTILSGLVSSAKNPRRSPPHPELSGELGGEGQQVAASSTGVLSTSNGSGIMSATWLRGGALGHTWERQLELAAFTGVMFMSRLAAHAAAILSGQVSSTQKTKRSLQLPTLPGELGGEGQQAEASSTGVLSTSNGSGIMSPTCLPGGAWGHTCERQLELATFTGVPSMSKFAAPATAILSGLVSVIQNPRRSPAPPKLPGEVGGNGQQVATRSTGALSVSNGSGILSPTCLHGGAGGAHL